MAYKQPTRRKSKRNREQLNLIPILDSVFIFLFFLLMSSQFLKIYEIGSDIPILSQAEPPKSKEKPLGLTVEIRKEGFLVSTMNPRTDVQIKKLAKDYDLEGLHTHLVKLKQIHKKEKMVILEPVVDVEYQEIINIMDAVRMFKNTDEQLFMKDKDGIEVRVKELFNNIIFGNLMS
jgi:biopolymer transport protein ExbD